MKAIKELWLFLCLMVALALAYSGKANSAELQTCMNTPDIRVMMAQEQFRMVRVDLQKDHAVVTYKRHNETVQWVFLPTGVGCLLNTREGGA